MYLRIHISYWDTAAFQRATVLKAFIQVVPVPRSRVDAYAPLDSKGMASGFFVPEKHCRSRPPTPLRCSEFNEAVEGYNSKCSSRLSKIWFEYNVLKALEVVYVESQSNG
jgi:hypothetical protein